MAEQHRALSAEVKLQRLIQVQRMADLLVAIADAARVDHVKRLPALLIQLRVANNVLRVLGETSLSSMEILGQSATVGVNPTRLLSLAVEALGTVEPCARTEENTTPPFTGALSLPSWTRANCQTWTTAVVIELGARNRRVGRPLRQRRQ